MPRGGARNGVAGKAYQNRTDLRGQNVVQAKPSNQPGAKLAVQAATGQAYGAAGAQKAAQSVIPMASQPSASVSASQPVAPATMGAPLPTAPQPLNAPTNHGLPITTGIDSGPGAGSEAMAPTLPDQMSMKALSLLNQLGDNISPQVLMVRNYLQAQAQNGFNR